MPPRTARPTGPALARAAARLAAVALLLGLAGGPAPARAYDPWEDAPPHEEEDHSRLSLTAWAGEYSGVAGSGRSSAGLLAGELAWRFDAVELGAMVEGARFSDVRPGYSPVYLLRFTERFETRRGLDATLTFGLGAGREERWKAWYQVALGARLELGPLFLAAELAFEQADLLRFAAGLGARF